MSTLKQRKAVNEIVENGGNISKGMRAAGYSIKTSKTPKKLTSSKGFIELFKETITDDFKIKKHKQFLESDDEKIGVRALDLAYKIDGNFSPEKKLNVNINAEAQNNPVTKKIADKYETELRAILNGTPKHIDNKLDSKE